MYSDPSSEFRLRPLAVVVSGAPGSGKTTLARALSESMGLPHLNKDLVCSSLRRLPQQRQQANERAFEITYATARSWLAAGLSLVMDMTMYAEYSPANVGSLQPYGVVVNVHTRSRDGLARWEAKMQRYGGGPVVEERIRRVRRDYDELAQPLEFGCPRVDVSTFSGYEPALAEVVLAIEAEHRAAPPCSTHM
jgi:predicted kinase